jgi:hypothetical protein
MSQWGNKDFANNVPKFLNTGAANTYFSNSEVYLVNAARLANASFGSGKAVAHEGWVKVIQGTGGVKSIAVSNVNANLVYTNAYVSFAGSNTTPANAQIVVVGGNNVSVILNNEGVGYSNIPTASVSGANNTTLVFTVTPSGRAGRVSAETLVAMSDPQVANANSGLPYFTGV